MRGSRLQFLSLVVLLAALVLGGAGIAAAQDTGTTDYEGHPLLGTWHLLADDGDGDTSCPSQVAYTDDGAYIDVDCDNFVVIGTWAPTGDRTANVTFDSIDEDGAYRVRAAVEVAEDGQSFTATYTFEPVDPATGEGMGEYGPGTATGTRLVAEAPGTPQGSMVDLFAAFDEVTPEATPAS